MLRQLQQRTQELLPSLGTFSNFKQNDIQDNNAKRGGQTVGGISATNDQKQIR